MWKASHQDGFRDREGKHLRIVLRDDRNGVRDLLPCERVVNGRPNSVIAPSCGTASFATV